MSRRRIPIFLLVASAVFLFAYIPQASAAYSHYRAITVDHTKVGSNLTNFPVLVSGNYSYLATAANGGKVQNANGYDVAFTSDVLCTTKLTWETDSYNAATGAVVYWVNLPTLSNTTNTVFYECYGDASVSTDQSNKTGVWNSNYKGVWHFGNGTALNASDSTSNGNNGTVSGVNPAAGVLGGAGYWYNTTDTFTVNGDPVNGLDSWSASAIVYTGSSNWNPDVIFNAWDSGAGTGWHVQSDGAPASALWGTGKGIGYSWGGASADSAIPVNNWTWITATWNSSGTPQFYQNGVLQTSAVTNKSGNMSHTANLSIGYAAAFSYYLYIDEARISSGARTAEWVSTEYNNQNSPSTFYTVSVEAAPPGPTFHYYRAITIDHTKVGGSAQTDFPVLVSGVYSYLATVANGGKVQNANGYDVAFYADSALTVQLQHETESYNSTTGNVTYWVRIPSVSNTSDTTFFMAYDDNTTTTDLSNKTGVWDSNYVGVFHLAKGASLLVNDSTANAGNATAVNGASATNGKVDGAGSFVQASNQFVDVNNSAALNPTSITASAWFYANSWPGNSRILQKGTPSVNVGDSGYRLTPEFGVFKWDIYKGAAAALTTSIPSTGAWHYAVGTYDSSGESVLYLDGVAVVSNAFAAGAISSSTSDLYIGHKNGASGVDAFDGVIDEVRISSTARSADWVTAEYNNQNSPSTFYSVSAESPTAGPVFHYSRPITIDHTKVGAGTQSDFPILVSGVYSYLATVANGGKVQNANGFDIAFYAEPSLTTKLNHETEYYNATTGNVTYWVRVPAVSNTTDTTFYIAYGDVATTTDQSNATGVWDANFVSVYHFPNGTSLSTNDSTSNGYYGTNNGATARAGKFGGGAYFNGSAYVNTSSYRSFGNTLSYSMWVKTSASGTVPLDISADSGAHDVLQLYITGAVRYALYSGSNNYFANSVTSVTNSSWYLLTGVYNGSHLLGYVNGVSEDSQTASGSVNASSQPLIIGRDGLSGSNGYAYTGDIDEVRISNVSRSAGWIWTEYNNEYSPSTFYSMGSESSLGPLFCASTANSLCPVNWTKLIGVQNSSGGYNNAHAQNATYGTYSNSVCCTASPTGLTTACGTTILRLVNVTNSHVQQSNESSYSTTACLSPSTGGMTCEYDDTACAAGFSCVASIIGQGNGNSTDAHVGDCAQYTRKVCCEYVSYNVCVNETGNCYQTIQLAVNAASAGQTVVIIDNGTYNESINLTKSLTFTSNSTSGLPLWNSSNVTVNVSGANVTFRNLQLAAGSIAVLMGSTENVSFNQMTVMAPSIVSGTSHAATATTTFIDTNITNSGGNACVYGASTVLINRSTFNCSYSGVQESYIAYVQDSRIFGTFPFTYVGTNIVTSNVSGSQISGYGGSASMPGQNFAAKQTNIYSSIINASIGDIATFYISNSTLDSGSAIALAGGNGTVVDTTVYSTNQIKLSLGYGHDLIFIINSTILPQNVSFSGMSGDYFANVSFQQYLDVYVNNTAGSAMSGANVNATDKNGLLAFAVSTNGAGNIVRQNVTYAWNYSNATVNVSAVVTNHTVTANKTGAGTDNATVNMTTNHAITLTLGNHAPSVPTLVAPTNASNQSVRYPTFNWTASTDAEGDAITYQWNISSPTGCAAIPLKNTSSLYYTSIDKLCVDKAYNWSVRACDNSNACSAYATNWTFTVQSSVGVAFTRASADFGSVQPSLPSQNNTNDTLSNSPLPLVYNNTGNVDIATTLKANAALWSLQGLNTSYFQYSDENSSAWANVTSSYTVLNANVTTSLLRELEFKIWVPQGEPAGTKNTTVTVLGASIE